MKCVHTLASFIPWCTRDLALEVSNTTLKIDDFLREFTETRKAIKITVYYSKKIHMTVRKGKEHIGRNPGDTRRGFQLLSSCRVAHTVLHFSSTNVLWHTQNVDSLGHVSMEHVHR